MAGTSVRVVIVGASTPLGKEVADQFMVRSSLAWNLALVDEGEGGQLSAAGDEAMLVSSITADAFSGADLVCFAGPAQQTRQWWREAERAGACIVDLSRALESEAGAVVLAPGVGRTPVDLATTVVVPADPAALMLASVLLPLTSVVSDAVCAATVLLPASQWGEAAIEELHRQTVALLSFQSVPKEFFDAQSAFALVGSFGEDSKANLQAEEQAIQRHLGKLAGAPVNCAVQAIAAPVFHGITASVWIAGADPEVAQRVIEQLQTRDLIELHDGSEEISNTSASGQPKIQLRVRNGNAAGSSGLWLWMAADNLQLAAVNALACASELIALRPPSTVQ